VTSSAEGGVTSLAAKGLDPLSLTMLAISDESVDVSVGDSSIGACFVGASEAFSIDPDGVLLDGFSPHSRDVLAQGLVSHLRGKGDRGDNLAGCGA
jgi:hypothetical protein